MVVRDGFITVLSFNNHMSQEMLGLQYFLTLFISRDYQMTIILEKMILKL